MTVMDYYYYDDPQSQFGYQPVPVDDVVAAMQRIAKREGVVLSDEDILRELGLKKHKSIRRKKGSRRRISLYIDGTNLFAGQYDLFGPKKVLSFRALLKDIKKYYPVSKVYFYASYTPRKPKRRPAAFFSSEAIFYRDVRSVPGLIFYKGHRSPTSGKEKGVDVHLALDMVKDAFLKKYDESVIMTGDADLVYAVQIVRKLGFPVYAIFFPNRFSLGLSFATVSSIVLNYLNRFAPKKDAKIFPRSLRVVAIKDPACKQTG